MPDRFQGRSTDIAGEYYNWRYFSAALERLGSRSEGRLGGNVPPAQIKAERDYMALAGDLFKGAMGGFEARRNASYKLADDWLAKHSLEEYHQIMKEGGVPFQDDPLAMQRLKYRHGRTLSQLAEEEFQSRIDRGEFVGKEPEEVDEAHYQHLYDVLNENADTFTYQTDGDYFFNQGFWEDSEANREKVFSSSQRVSDDYHTQQALIETESTIMGLVTDQHSSAEAIYGAFEQAENAYGYRITPTQRMTIAKNILEGLSARIGGDTIIAKLANKKIPNLDQTFKDVFGEEGLRAYSIQSRNLTYEYDREQRLEDWTFANKAINEGNFLALQEKWAEEEGLNGKTDRADFFFKMLGQAKTQYDKDQNSKIANAAGGTIDAIKRRWAEIYIERTLRGEEVRNSGNKEWWTPVVAQAGVDISNSKVKLTESEISKVFEDMFKADRLSAEELAIGASRTDMTPFGTFNPAKRAVESLASTTMSQIGASITQAARNNQVSNIQVPKYFDKISEIYTINPQAMSNLSDKDANMLQQMLFLQAQGIPVEQQLQATALMTAKEDEKDFKELENKTQRHLNNTDFITLGGGDLDVVGSANNLSLFRTSASWFYMSNGGNMSEAIESAKDMLSRTHFNFDGSLINAEYFRSTSYPKINPVYIATKMNAKVDKVLEEAKVPKSAVNVIVNPLEDNQLQVVDWVNSHKIYYAFSREDIDREAEEFINESREEMEKYSHRRGMSKAGEIDFNDEFRRMD